MGDHEAADRGPGSNSLSFSPGFIQTPFWVSHSLGSAFGSQSVVCCQSSLGFLLPEQWSHKHSNWLLFICFFYPHCHEFLQGKDCFLCTLSTEDRDWHTTGSFTIWQILIKHLLSATTVLALMGEWGRDGLWLHGPAWFSGKSYKRHQGRIHWGRDAQVGGGDLETQRENKQHMQKKSSVGRLRGNCNGAESWIYRARNTTVNLLALSQEWQIVTNGF